jgi:putative molybdopterin biosynthesis protein
VLPLAAARPREIDLTIMGSHCLGVDVLVDALARRGVRVKVVAVGSEAGLAALVRGAADLAPVHLLDPATLEYNTPFLPVGVELVKGYGRMQGLVHRADDPRFSPEDVREAIAAAVAANATLINRNAHSGTRVLIDSLLDGLRPAGYRFEASSHHAVVAAIAQGRADFGVAIEPVVRAASLAFKPIRAERLDFAVRTERRERPAVREFVAALEDASVVAALGRVGFVV